jgi:hypothetical protein
VTSLFLYVSPSLTITFSNAPTSRSSKRGYSGPTGG